MGEECGKLNSVQRVFKRRSKKLWRGEALNEFVADPLRHRQTDRQTDRGVRVWGAVNSKKNRGLVMQLS